MLLLLVGVVDILQSQEKRRVKILILDDSPELLNELKMALDEHGYDITAVDASKGQWRKAIDLIQEEQFDLIITDWFFGKKDPGDAEEETAKDFIAMAQQRGVKEIPRIFRTTDDNPDARDFMTELGFAQEAAGLVSLVNKFTIQQKVGLRLTEVMQVLKNAYGRSLEKGALFNVCIGAEQKESFFEAIPIDRGATHMLMKEDSSSIRGTFDSGLFSGQKPWVRFDIPYSGPGYLYAKGLDLSYEEGEKVYYQLLRNDLIMLARFFTQEGGMPGDTKFIMEPHFLAAIFKARDFILIGKMELGQLAKLDIKKAASAASSPIVSRITRQRQAVPLGVGDISYSRQLRVIDFYQALLAALQMRYLYISGFTFSGR
ncbi:MAG: response regulator [Candidatus Omnitrophota bacterium]|nr:MAG: response regulator [Candidatus Omnitrophota bacterium]